MIGRLRCCQRMTPPRCCKRVSRLGCCKRAAPPSSSCSSSPRSAVLLVKETARKTSWLLCLAPLASTRSQSGAHAQGLPSDLDQTTPRQSRASKGSCQIMCRGASRQGLWTLGREVQLQEARPATEIQGALLLPARPRLGPSRRQPWSA